MMMELGQEARKSATILAGLDAKQRSQAINAMGHALPENAHVILKANQRDMKKAQDNKASPAFLDRLFLDEQRLQAMADSLHAIAAQPDPLGEVLAQWERPNGLRIHQVTGPIGVLAVIYESRPNVTAEAAGLAIRSGNAIILRSGQAAFETCQNLYLALSQGVQRAGLPKGCLHYVPTPDRKAAEQLMEGLGGTVDLLIPRGGKGLIEVVRQKARIPVLSHLDGVCHIYVHQSANPEQAHALVLNAKMRRTGVCNALECLLMDRVYAQQEGKDLIKSLIEAGCEVRGDEIIQGLHASVRPAGPGDWGHEYLDAVLSVRTVDGPEEALEHISLYGSGHTDAIVAEDPQIAEDFLRRVDSAVVLHNASTAFSDGGEFGFGGEIGIATGRFGPRGPIGARHLTSYHYEVRGTGQTRP